MTRRLALVSFCVCLAFVGCTGEAPAPRTSAPPPGSPTASEPPEASPSPRLGSVAAAACSLPPDWLLAIRLQYPPDRAGEIQFIPREPNLPGPALPHTGPYPYVREVPLFVYGPGLLPGAGRVDRPVTVADIAPTIGELVGFSFDAPDGIPLSEAIEEVASPPRLVVTVVLDAGGRNVLNAWPEHWPNLEGLIPEGTWYERATTGAAPDGPATLSVHATIGTGAFPRTHGLSGRYLRLRGEAAVLETYDPRLLRVPSLADEYDAAMGNEPVIGALASVGTQLGLLGHGSLFPGGDKDLAVLRDQPVGNAGGDEGDEWNLLPEFAEFLEFPEYANDLPPLPTYFREVDELDGTVDGAWRGHQIGSEELIGGFTTPARIPYQTRLIEEVVRREGFGADDVPDLLFINFKAIDDTGHRFGLESEEMGDTVRMQDRYLPDLLGILDDNVGAGRWALVLTADHGAAPDPVLNDAIQIAPDRLETAIEEEFDSDEDDAAVVERVGQSQVFVDIEELRQNGADLMDVSAFMLGLTNEELADPTTPPPPDKSDEPTLAAAFPTSALSRLPCVGQG